MRTKTGCQHWHNKETKFGGLPRVAILMAAVFFVACVSNSTQEPDTLVHVSLCYPDSITIETTIRKPDSKGLGWHDLWVSVNLSDPHHIQLPSSLGLEAEESITFFSGQNKLDFMRHKWDFESTSAEPIGFDFRALCADNRNANQSHPLGDDDRSAILVAKYRFAVREKFTGQIVYQITRDFKGSLPMENMSLGEVYILDP